MDNITVPNSLVACIEEDIACFMTNTNKRKFRVNGEIYRGYIEEGVFNFTTPIDGLQIEYIAGMLVLMDLSKYRNISNSNEVYSMVIEVT